MSKIDLCELARLRWIRKWTFEDLAKYYERKYYTIQMHIIYIRKNKWQNIGLSQDEIVAMRESDKSKFWEKKNYA